MFKCESCGSCCRNVGRSEIYQDLDRGDGCCKYINLDTNKCSIYGDRPLVCRVDDMYKFVYSKNMNFEEYYKLNYEACEKLREIAGGEAMNDMKSYLTEKFEEIFGYEPGDDYEPRVRNALKIICQGKYNKEEILEIEDTSISSNGKSGLVLTIDSICVKDSGNFTSKFIAKYEDIDYTYINEDSFLGSDITALELNMKYGTTYKISIWGRKRRELMEFIDYAMSLYQEEDDKLEW